MSRSLKAEWWELWCVKPGVQPVFVKMYGQPTLPWIPDGCFPTAKGARLEKDQRGNRFDRIYHVRRYSK